MIRWISSEITIFAYFKNFVLVACYLGCGLGALTSIRVRHPLEVLYHDVGAARLRAKVARHWHGGQVACYYGCQLVRPYGEADCDSNPMRMDELLRAVGVPTVDYSLKTKC